MIMKTALTHRAGEREKEGGRKEKETVKVPASIEDRTSRPRLPCPRL